MHEWSGAENNIYRFAMECASGPVKLNLRLKSDTTAPSTPDLTIHSGRHLVKLEIKPSGDDQFDVVVVVEKGPVKEEEWEITLNAKPADKIPECRIFLRWTNCIINDALLLRDPVAAAALKTDKEAAHRWAQTKAALLWHSYKRFSEVVGLKRFTSGLGGSDVLVFRPRLRNPNTTRADFVGTVPLNAVCQAWGASLLIKTGTVRKCHEEWERYRVFLADRTHPFMSRSEEFLTVRPPNTGCIHAE